jgi:hypothetical protein
MGFRDVLVKLQEHVLPFVWTKKTLDLSDTVIDLQW